MPITTEVILTSLFIIAARIADVSMGTLRTMAVINGRRGSAWLLGFFEVLVWIVVVSKVIETVDQNPLYAVAYALGFATGNFIGITIEGRIAFGDQVLRVFTREGAAMAAALRQEGSTVTEFQGMGRDGPVQMLFIQTRRKNIPAVVQRARAIDPTCYYVVDDIRAASARLAGQSGIRGVEKMK